MYRPILTCKFFLGLLTAVTISGCTPGGSDGLDPVFGQLVGDSAFVSTPSSLNFGNVNVSSRISRTMTIKNGSNTRVYVSTVTSNNGAYEIVSENCPKSPNAMKSGDSCTVTIDFAPLTAGLTGAALGIRYGTKEDASGQYLTNFGLSGTGVSQLIFAGLQSLGPQTNKTMTLNWIANSNATSYIIFRMLGGLMVFEKTVPNTSGTVALDIVQNLQPSTNYTWRVRALDVFGISENNTVDVTALTAPNQLPVLSTLASQSLYQGVTWTTNFNEASTGNDSDLDGDVLTYACFYDTVVNGVVAATNACATLLNENGTPATFIAASGTLTWTPPFSVTPGTQYEIKVTGSDQFGGAGARIFTAVVNSGTPILTYSAAGPFIFPSNFISSSVPLALNLSNTRTGTDLGVDTYACAFDRVADGAVTVPTDCVNLPGAASFNVTTGVLNWTPTASSWGTYEFLFTATNLAGSDTQLAVVAVKPQILNTNLVSYWDASFADNAKSGVNMPFLANWSDIKNAGGAYDGTLTGFVGTASSGWIDTPVPALAFDGASAQASFANFIGGLTNFAFDLWVQPSSANAGIVWSNADGVQRGVTLKQAATDGGQWVLSGGGASFEDEVLADGPEGFYRLNEIAGSFAFDISGNGRHAAYTASVTRGIAGSISDADLAVNLNGSNGSILAPITIGTTVTIEIWAQANNWNTHMLWRTGPNGAGPDLFFAGGKISLNTWDSDANAYCNIPAAISDGNFHQYVNVIDAATMTSQFYFDGALCGTANYRNPAAPTISFSSGLSSYEWDGKMDEAVVYSSALTAGRVQAHYAARSRATCRTRLGVQTDRWTHLFAGYNDSTKALSLWVNGVNQCTKANPTSLAGTSQGLVMGRGVAVPNPWQGLLGEARVYSSASSAASTTNFSVLQPKYDQHVPVQGLKLWLKADALNFLSPGSPVAFWKDQSLAGNHAVQNNSAAQPLYSANGMNGRPAVVYDTNRCLVTQFADTLSDHTIFLVFKDDGIAQAYERILDKDYAAGLWIGRDSNTASTYLSGFIQSSPPYGISNTFADGSAHVLTSQRAGTAHTLYANGVSPVTGVVSNATTSSQPYGIGCWFDGSGSQRFGGLLSEVVIYNSALSSADRLRVERYLGNKYLITVP